MSKTKIERAIELHYQNCHIPVLCKNKSYADAATGRKVDPLVAKEYGRVMFVSDSMQYVNQKLDKPIYHEFFWNEDKVIHHKVIRATRISKHGMDWKDVYHARFFCNNENPVFEGEGIPQYWLNSDREILFEGTSRVVHNWLYLKCPVVNDIEELNTRMGYREHMNACINSQTDIKMFSTWIDLDHYCTGYSEDFVFKHPGTVREDLNEWINGIYKKKIDAYRKQHGIKKRRFGCEIEFTGISRDTAARVVARTLGTQKIYKGGVYNEHHIIDRMSRTWKIVRDASIKPSVTADRQNPKLDHYKCELVTPILDYGDIQLLEKITSEIKAKGGVVNQSCGMHVHVEVKGISAIQLRNIVNITARNEDMLCEVLRVSPDRVMRWCHKTEIGFAEVINDIPRREISLAKIMNIWYGNSGSSHNHYDRTRYRILNLHSFVEGKGIEFRLFNATLDEKEVRANIVLALAICCTGCYLKRTRGYNNAYRCSHMKACSFERKEMSSFMNQVGIVGNEFSSVRSQLMKNMDGGRRVA